MHAPPLCTVTKKVRRRRGRILAMLGNPAAAVVHVYVMDDASDRSPTADPLGGTMTY